MLKFIGIMMLFRLVGNPFLALFILLVILYFLDRRYVGIFLVLQSPSNECGKSPSCAQQYL